MPQIFEVGGCVRDKLLGLQPKDIDFTFVLDEPDCTVAQGFELMNLWLFRNGFEIFLVTEDCFTIRAKFPKDHIHAGQVADFVMARKEVGYVEGTRRPILELGTLEDDLVRRDFTVNAMAFDEDGMLIDLFNGVQHLKEKVLRTPVRPAKTLLDDPLRLLRAMRFSITKGFEIEEGIWTAVIDNPEIMTKLSEVVSGERIREELMKMFKHDTLASLLLLREANFMVPNLNEILFKNGLWLQPTFKL